MKRRWRAGVLMGLSLAMLLAGGVGLAAGVYIGVDQECFECFAQQGVSGIPDDYVVELTLGGWGTRSEVCYQISDPANEHWAKWCAAAGDMQSPCSVALWVECDSLLGFVHDDCHLNDIAPMNGLKSHYGEWLAQVYEGAGESEISRDTIAFVFAEDCAALRELDFVTEPSSVLLLGGGLAGLAGYGVLRWRRRQ
jgi:hypothetical protein